MGYLEEKVHAPAEMGEKPSAVDVMWDRFLELEQRWQERLANQTQVISNLSAEREKMLKLKGTVQDVVGDLKELIRGGIANERERNNYSILLTALEEALKEVDG